MDERGRSRVCVDLERMRWLLSLRCSSSMANPMDGLRRLTPLGRDILRHVSDLDAMIGVALREYSVAPPHVQQVIRGWMLRWMADRDTAAQRLGFNPNTLQLDTLLDALQREVAGGAGGGAAVPRLIHDEQVGYEVFQVRSFYLSARLHPHHRYVCSLPDGLSSRIHRRVHLAQGFIDADGNQYPGRMLLALNRLIDFDLEADSLAVHAGSQLWGESQASRLSKKALPRNDKHKSHSLH